MNYPIVIFICRYVNFIGTISLLIQNNIIRSYIKKKTKKKNRILKITIGHGS
jgi:hypothetical protein